MNKRETAHVMMRMSAAWPAQDLPDMTVNLWAEELEGVSYETGMEAAKRLIREDHWFPSIARFLEMVRACAPRRTYAELEAAEDQPADPEAVAKVLQMTRHLLKRAEEAK